MVRERFRVAVCFWDNNSNCVANRFSDQYWLYNLYGLRFYVKEQFWGRHSHQKLRSITFGHAYCISIGERVLYTDRDTQWKWVTELYRRKFSFCVYHQRSCDRVVERLE